MHACIYKRAFLHFMNKNNTNSFLKFNIFVLSLLISLSLIYYLITNSLLLLIISLSLYIGSYILIVFLYILQQLECLVSKLLAKFLVWVSFTDEDIKKIPDYVYEEIDPEDDIDLIKEEIEHRKESIEEDV